MKRKQILFLSLSLLLINIFISCKKQEVNATTPAAPVVTSPSQVLDSSLIISKEFYLWYNQIPSTFNASSYADPGKLMEAIRQYSIEPGFTTPVDKWSFAMKQADWNNESNGIIMNNTNLKITGSFGMTVFFRVEGDLRVKLVEKASPAGQAGIQRGWRITKVNGNINITTANTTFLSDNIYSTSTSTFTFTKPDGSSVDVTLNTGTYKTQPVYLDTVYTFLNKKVGYLVFNSFLGDTIQINNDFKRVFANFSSTNVTDVVIDLRYNGGGYVSVQEKLADYLVANSANNGLMFKEQFNDKNPLYNQSTNFHKAGSVNIDHIYFIVSKGTASASELLINNLKPYMDVQLIGPSATYGKPVGFFPIAAGEWYVFPVSFKSSNKDGVGEYFNGLQVNSQVADGLDKNWGDITELCLARAIKRITTGSFTGRSSEVFIDLPEAVKSSNDKFDAPLFKGSIGNTIR